MKVGHGRIRQWIRRGGVLLIALTLILVEFGYVVWPQWRSYAAPGWYYHEYESTAACANVSDPFPYERIWWFTVEHDYCNCTGMAYVGGILSLVGQRVIMVRTEYVNSRQTIRHELLHAHGFHHGDPEMICEEL